MTKAGAYSSGGLFSVPTMGKRAAYRSLDSRAAGALLMHKARILVAKSRTNVRMRGLLKRVLARHVKKQERKHKTTA